MARYTVETPTGKKRKTVYGKTREEAHEKLVEALSNRNKGLIFEGEDQVLSAFLDRWLNGSVKGSVKPSTYESYERMIRNHINPTLGHRKLKNLAPDHVQYFYQSKLNAGLAVGTVRLMHGILHKALEQAVKWGACTPQHLQGHDASEAELRRDTSPGCRAGQAVPGGGPRQPPRGPLRACHHCGLEDRRAPGAQMGRHRP